MLLDLEARSVCLCCLLLGRRMRRLVPLPYQYFNRIRCQYRGVLAAVLAHMLLMRC